MASTDARPMPQKNVAYRVTFPIYEKSGLLVTGAAGLDSEVSKDGGSYTDCTNEATEIGSSGTYYLDLTSTEMNADTVAIIVKTSTTDARTTPIFLYPEEAGDVRVNVTQISGDGTAADNAESYFDGTGYAGTNNVIPLVTLTTTATNLTNAATAGDLTATMKTSVTTAATAATPTAAVSGDLSATMKTSVQTAATASLNAYDPPTKAEMDSGFASGDDAILAAVAALNNLSPAGVRTAIGLATANLDTQLAGVPDAVWDEVLSESDFQHTWASVTPRKIMATMFAGFRNKWTSTNSSKVLRNDADSAALGTRAIADDGTTYTDGEMG